MKRKLYPLKKISSFLICCAVAFTSCKKIDVNSTSSKEEESLEVTKPAEGIPPQILQLMYDDLLSQNLKERANSLKKSYDFETGKKITGKTNRYVSGVGDVVSDGSYIEVSGTSTSAHIQNLGWKPLSFQAMNDWPNSPDAYVSTAPTAGHYLGTVGQNLRIEAFKLAQVWYSKPGSGSGTMTFSYRSHVQNIGWQTFVSSPNVSGTTGQNLRIEAVQINVGPTNVLMSGCSTCIYQPKVYYRAHVQNLGWQNWVSAGQTAGTTGQNLRIEAMQIVLYLILV